MGTKAQPGTYDCHAKAEADEPMFTLLARDPLAAGLVRIWAALAGGHPASARVFFDDLVKETEGRATQPPEKWREAFELSDAMIAWRKSFETRSSSAPQDEAKPVVPRFRSPEGAAL